MVGDQLVVYIAGFGDALKASVLQDLRSLGGQQGIAFQSADVPSDLLRHRRGKHAGVRSGIGGQLLFIKLLGDPQRLVGTELKETGAVVLQLRQIIQKGRVLLLLFPLDLFNRRGFLIGLQKIDQRLRAFLFQEAVFFVKKRRLIPGGAFHRPPLSLEGLWCAGGRLHANGRPHAGRQLHAGGRLRADRKLRANGRPHAGKRLRANGRLHAGGNLRAGERLSSQSEGRRHPVKGGFDKLADLPLPVDHHAKHAGHDPAHGDDGPVPLQIIFHGSTVFQGEDAGEVDAHQVILLRPQIGGGAQIVVGGKVLRLPDAPEDLLLGLGIDPHPAPLFAVYAGLLLHQPVDVFPLPPGVRAHVDGLHVLPVQKGAYDIELLFHAGDHFVSVFLRQKGKGLKAPALQRRIIGLRIAHGHQMAHAPGHDGLLRFHVAVPVRHIVFQRSGKFAGHAGLFRDEKILSLFFTQCRTSSIGHAQASFAVI